MAATATTATSRQMPSERPPALRVSLVSALAAASIGSEPLASSCLTMASASS